MIQISFAGSEQYMWYAGWRANDLLVFQYWQDYKNTAALILAPQGYFF